MLTIAKPQQREKSWPALPYKGLSYYEPDDAPLFAGRDCDVIECADLLAREETRILLLHGSTGCGKSSFLRAGLIPFLEHDDLGFRVLKNDVDGKLTSIFIRATGKPLVELAKKVCDFLKSDIKFRKAGKEEFHLVNLPELVATYATESEFVEKVSGDPELFIKTLGEIAVRLPKTLILIIDQGEEVITLKPNPDEDHHLKRFFRFMELFSETCYDLKLLIALRTEFYGRFLGGMPQSQTKSTIAHYFLADLNKEQIVSAIERPTSSEVIKDLGVPFQHYKFRYEKGLPEKIASDLLSKKLAGGILPVMQIICDTLYQVVAATSNGAAGPEQREISEANYRALGSIEDQIDKSLDATFAQWCRENDITSDRDIEKETERWKDILSNLAGFQPDGTVTTAVVTADQLKEWTTESKSKLDFDKTIAHLVSPHVRILRDAEFFDARSEKVVRYSLGHDAIGLALYRWKVGRTEVASAISNARTRLRWLAVSLIVVGALSWLIIRPRSTAVSVFMLLIVAIYALFFFILSYASSVPGVDRFFYLLILMYPGLVGRNKLAKLLRDKKFLEIAKRNPAAYEHLQRLVARTDIPESSSSASAVTKSSH